MKFVDDAVSRQVAGDGNAELLAWPGKPITNNEYAFGEPIMSYLQEQKKSFKMRTLLLRDVCSGKAM